MKILIFISILFVSQSIYSQLITESNYTRIQSNGDFPSDWYFNLKDGSQTNFEETNPLVINSKDYQIVNDYVLKRLYNSGMLYFGDSITNYINDVASNVLSQAKPNLVGQFKFYTAASQYVNATSTSQGVIFVNLGLVAQLSTEAELAFILSHEMSHNLKHHTANRYYEEYENNSDDYSNESEKIFRKNYNSREDETEADINAFELLTRTNYDLNGAYSVFDVLQYSYLPIDNIPFDTNYYNLPTLDLGLNYLKPEDINRIAVDENYKESKSTHPKCINRRSEIYSHIEDNGYDGNGEKFHFSQERFNRIRDYARFEVVYEQILSGEIAEALYNIYILRRKYPDNKFLKQSEAFCFYVAQKYINRKKIRSVVSDYKSIEGESEQVYWLLRNVDSKVMNVLAVRKLYDLAKEYPTDNFIRSVYLDAIKDMMLKQDLKLSMFRKKTKQEELADTNKSVYRSSKYKNIKKNLVDQQDYKYAFTDCYNDTLFHDNMIKIEDLVSSINKQSENDEEETEIIPESELSSILFTSPDFLLVKKYKYIKKHQAKYVSILDNYRENMVDGIVKSGDRLNRDFNILDFSNDINTAKYNDKMLADNIFYEALKTYSDMPMILYSSQYSNHLRKTYNSRVIAWQGAITGKEGFDNIDPVLFVASIYVLPIVIPYLLIPDYNTTGVLIVYDLETNKIIHENVITIGNGKSALPYCVYNNISEFIKIHQEK